MSRSRPDGGERTAADAPFARVLGNRRGDGGAPGEAPGLPARERARAFFRFLNRDEPLGDRLAHLREERTTARDLGLNVSHGNWVEIGNEDDIGPPMLTMLHDAYTGRLVAIIEMTEQGQGALFLVD